MSAKAHSFREILGLINREVGNWVAAAPWELQVRQKGTAQSGRRRLSRPRKLHRGVGRGATCRFPEKSKWFGSLALKEWRVFWEKKATKTVAEPYLMSTRYRAGASESGTPEHAVRCEDKKGGPTRPHSQGQTLASWVWIWSILSPMTHCWGCPTDACEQSSVCLTEFQLQVVYPRGAPEPG